MMNKNGPNTEPWGRPAETGNKPEEWDLTEARLPGQSNTTALRNCNHKYFNINISGWSLFSLNTSNNTSCP